MWVVAARCSAQRDPTVPLLSKRFLAVRGIDELTWPHNPSSIVALILLHIDFPFLMSSLSASSILTFGIVATLFRHFCRTGSTNQQSKLSWRVSFIADLKIWQFDGLLPIIWGQFAACFQFAKCEQRSANQNITAYGLMLFVSRYLMFISLPYGWIHTLVQSYICCVCLHSIHLNFQIICQFLVRYSWLVPDDWLP